MTMNFAPFYKQNILLIFLPDVCESYAKCQNGGVCIRKTNNTNHVAACKCINGFHGEYCQNGK